MFTVFYSNCGFGKQWRTDNVLIASGGHRIKTHGTQYIPSTHLSAVFITRYTLGGITVLLGQYLMHSLLGFIRSIHKIIQIGHVVTGLVSMGVLPDKSGNICLITTSGLGMGRK